MSIPRATALLVLLFTCAVAVPVGLLVVEQSARVDAGRGELAALESLRRLRTALELVPRHARLAADTRAVPSDELAAVRAEIERALAAAPAPEELRLAWRQLADDRVRRAPSERDERSAALLVDLRDAMSRAGAPLAADPAERRPAEALAERLPTLQTTLVQQSALAEGAALRRRLSPEERTRLVVSTVLVRADLDALAALGDGASEATAAAQRFEDVLATRLLGAGSVDVPPEELSAAGQEALAAEFALWDRTAAELDGRLAWRLERAQGERALTIAGGLAVLALGWAIALVLARRLERRRVELAAALEQRQVELAAAIEQRQVELAAALERATALQAEADARERARVVQTSEENRMRAELARLAASLETARASQPIGDPGWVEVAAREARLVEALEQIAVEARALAFNASIEATHAGKAGRGLGILARELRGLANRSADAARDGAAAAGVTPTASG